MTEEVTSMNKPSWHDAPRWANYLAQDMDGAWYWFESKPHTTSLGYWVEADSSKYELACENPGYDVENWRETLEEASYNECC